jgi:hypothetical protein
LNSGLMCARRAAANFGNKLWQNDRLLARNEELPLSSHPLRSHFCSFGTADGARLGMW